MRRSAGRRTRPRSPDAIKAAHEQFRRGIQMSLQGNFQEVAAQLTMEDAETHAIVGQCAEARSEVAAGLELSRDNVTLERASRVLALCGAEREALSLSSELAKRFPDATLTIRVSLPVTAAALAHAARRRRRARSNCSSRSGRTITRRRRSSGPPTSEARRTFS